jgi:hypothetical protein
MNDGGGEQMREKKGLRKRGKVFRANWGLAGDNVK